MSQKTQKRTIKPIEPEEKILITKKPTPNNEPDLHKPIPPLSPDEIEEELLMYEETKNNTFKLRIYCHCVYEFKDELKKLGFFWDPEFKLWYIRQDKFTEDIFNKSRKTRYINKEGTIRYYYVHYKERDEILAQKPI